MKRILIAATVCLAVAACGGGSAQVDHPGNPAVYQRIAAESDCAQLQAEFDTASGSFDRAAKGTPESAAAIGYMQAAQDRMKDLSC